MRKAWLSLLLVFCSIITFAQQQNAGNDGKVDLKVNTNNEPDMWYTSPWVWLLATAVFILVLMVLLRGSKRRIS